MSRGGHGAWVAALAAALLGGACTRGGAREDITTVQSAVTTDVVITVTDGASVPLANMKVYALENNGTLTESEWTNASGQATLTLPANSYRFLVSESGSDFYSGEVGHCVTPGCSSAQIMVPYVAVTVVDTNGAPQIDQAVFWETSTDSGGWLDTDATGHVSIAVPPGAYQFEVTQNGWDFFSGGPGSCTVPSCTQATITTTVPITVTVKNTNNVPQPNLTIGWEDTAEESGGWQDTDANGVATLSAPPGAYRFIVYTGNTDFTSGAPGHCVVPGCTSASITIGSPVVVTVVDTGGTPLAGKTVVWQNEATDVGGDKNTNASGQATMIPPLVPVRFRTTVDGAKFYSSETFDCAQPGCATATILVSQPSVVTVVDGSGAPVSGKAVTPLSDEGITSSNKTTNASGQATFRLPFGHWRFRATCASNSEQFFSGNAGHCYLPGGCLTAKIKMPCGQCAGKPNGFACDDQTACSGSSTCQSQKCTGASPMSCSASDQCHDVGACGAEAGACSNPPKANGSSCNDNNACTGTSSCQAGVCTGGSPVTCTASDQCHDAGTCNPATGTCSNPAKANGSSCSDGNSCTAPDTCQSGICAAGPNTCASIAVTQTVATHQAIPRMSATMTTDVPSAVPGDLVTFTAAVTNTGTELNFVGGELDVQNPGASMFTVAGFQQRLEYLDAQTGVWTPFARVVYDASGNVVPETPQTALTQIPLGFFPFGASSGATYPQSGNSIVGTTIASGGNGHWAWGANFVVSADIVAILFDLEQSSGLRSVFSFDLPSGSPQSHAVAFDYPGYTGDLLNVAVQLAFHLNLSPEGGGALTPTETGPLAPGAVRILTRTFTAPPMTPFPLPGGETEEQYRNRLVGTFDINYAAIGTVTGTGGPLPATDIGVGLPQGGLPVDLPLLHNAQKTGPAAINAGLTGTFNVALPNHGRSVAQSLALTDSVDGQPVTIGNLTLPTSIAPSATGAALFTASSPLSRPAGPMTDVARLTWQDRNGNAYGPILASFTTNLGAGHPEGYLSMQAATGLTDVIGVGKPFVVTALAPNGNPAPGVAVHFVVTGVNPQTADVTTGADGKATFTYAGTTMGDDSVIASATITTTPITLAPVSVQWGTAIGTPCTGRATPLDIMLVVDVSSSMVLEPPNFSVSAGKLEAARTAAHRFMDNLSSVRDKVGVIVFRGGIDRFVPLSSDSTDAKTQLDSGIEGGLFCATNLCGFGGSDVAEALDTALNELESARHRPGATKVVIYVGDGGNDDGSGQPVDPTPQLTRLRNSGARAVSIAIGSTIDGVLMRQIADSANDYFYAPSAAGIDFAFNNLNQDLCRNLAPIVSAGGDQGVYGVRVPDFLRLEGEVHDDGPDGDRRLVSAWSVISGPAPVTFVDASAPVTQALFIEPGTYVIQLAASDGYLTVADRATIIVDPEPNLTGGNLVVALGSPSPLTTGTTETVTATLRDASSAPIGDFPILLTVAGPNPLQTTAITNAAGVATFTYTGKRTGTDQLHATAFAPTFQLDSPIVGLTWNDPPTGGPLLTQGWIKSPIHQTPMQQTTPLMERVEILLSDQITLTSGTLTYWPEAHPTEVHTLATGLTGAPGALLATLDTTLLANGSYIIQLDGVDDANHQRQSQVLVTVAGDYKPGRVVVELTDFTVPIAGMPITVGRRYDSLEKDRVGDFGYGWSLVLGNPKLEVDAGQNVAMTMPNGRRVTFNFAPTFPAVGLVGIGFLLLPAYAPAPGVFGTLTSDGCSVLMLNLGGFPLQMSCFLALSVEELQYAPTKYTYTDPYGTVYVMGATGELRSITDRQGNSLTFQPNGIISSTGKSVAFTRDAQGRITQVDYPEYFGPEIHAASYTYDTAGDLVTVQLPPVPGQPSHFMQHDYNAHRLVTTTDPRGNPARTSTYYPDGRLATDKDALNHVTTYEYDLETRTNTTTYPDDGIITQVFDTRGLVVSETDQRGNTTTHEYDPTLNETKRTNALGEVTTAIYNQFTGNQTEVNYLIGTTLLGSTHTAYNTMNLPDTFIDRLGQVTTIEYDARGVPSRIADQDGTRFKFTNSEQGLPLVVEDAGEKRAYLEYDAAGNVTGRTDWLGRITRATYDEAGHKLTETTARGATTKYSYIAPGWNSQTIRPNPATGAPTGYTTNNAYDRNGNLIVTEDELSPRRRTDYAYDALNHVTEVSHPTDGPGGTKVTYERDFRGNPTKMIDENGHTTRYVYDKAGNLTKTIFEDDTPATLDDNPFTTRTYDELNRLETVTDERGPGHTTTYEYEPGCGCSDRVTKVIDPLGATVTTYDANGRRQSVTDANNHTTTFVYDVRGHVRETHFHDGTSTSEEYDSRGRRISMTDQMDKTTSYGYDDQGQLTSVTDPLNNVTQYGYDLDGNLTSVTDANTHPTTYGYDLLKRKIKRTLPMQQFETFGYDLFGNQTSHIDFRGRTTTMTYDVRERMLTKVPDPSLGEASHVYTYWPNGLRHTATNASGTTTYEYDERDRLKSKATPAGILAYTYDKTGNLKTINASNPDGASNPNRTSVTYAWDAANQLSSVTDNRVAVTTTATYTPTRKPETLLQPNGIGLTYSYDALDRVTSMLWRHGTSPAFGSWAYTHNARGQRLTSTDITGRVATYGYDNSSRLTSEIITGDPRGATFNGALSYVLDAVGNRSSRTSTLAALGNQSLTYNADDELDSDTYDANGNTLTSGGHTYAYDFENRLVSKDGGAVTVTYDCDGNRVAKTVGGVTTTYVVDDLNPTGYLHVLEEVVGGAVQTRYTYGTGVVSQTRNVSGTPATTFYGFDAHGNITFLTDAIGIVTDSYDYDAWGNVVAQAGTTPNNRLYAGEEFDPDLGLMNLRARHYSPDSGRFSTIDPLLGSPANPASFNRYLYTSVDPVNFGDPLGQATAIESSTLTTAVAGALIFGATVYLGSSANKAQGLSISYSTSAASALGEAAACNLLAATWTDKVSDNFVPQLMPYQYRYCPTRLRNTCEQKFNECDSGQNTWANFADCSGCKRECESNGGRWPQRCEPKDPPDPCRAGFERCLASPLGSMIEGPGLTRCTACLLLCESLGYWSARLTNGNACLPGADAN